MIILLSVIVAVVSVFEITGMVKRKQTKEIAVFVAIALLSLVLGYYYIMNSHSISFIHYILDISGIKI